MIHAYKNNGYDIVLDVNSGSVHVVDDVVFDLVHPVEELLSARFGSADIERAEGESDDEKLAASLYEQLSEKNPCVIGSYPESDVKDALSDILELRRAGVMYTDDVYENYVEEFKERDTVVKALCLNIAHDCNLRCKYCFADEGEYHGRRALMTEEVGKAALDFLVKNSGSRKNLEVDFFGGEPLLNWEVVKKLVEYGRSIEKEHNKNFRFTLTTNGTLLNDEILEFANKEMGNIVLSIDGRKEVNDKMRPLKGGQGTYDTIVPKFKKVAESRHQLRYFVRGTFTHNNLDFFEDVKHLADLGFKQISVEPVVAKPEDWYSIKEEDIPYLCDQYDKLAKFYLERKKEGNGFNFFHFNIDLEGGPCVAKRLSGCGSGCEYLGVTPWGDLYPCHQFVGNEDFIMGNVFDGITRKDIQKQFKESNVYSRPECQKCFARYYCSGGCAANAYNFNGDINTTYKTGCELQRKRIECAIMIKAAQSEGVEE
ncbi:MAG: thioether cross-link-forming SCIFF peptide maturase [Butyrivibrio sp.]|uniref:thioether cross-link-forming SCIFF peptide maturase n=1 Tax=Butyrivibrio sp. NC2002 TaxID=1410610 RepID=UPI0005647365|nr:thioether cross-link-forming SCIFF peptide maturase [Butyrivibrio sp. NC2002]MBE5860172.1 thioether cross-link-forming SCIFF peptide maturase [Butyrivibrio sp.]